MAQPQRHFVSASVIPTDVADINSAEDVMEKLPSITVVGGARLTGGYYGYHSLILNSSRKKENAEDRKKRF